MSPIKSYLDLDNPNTYVQNAELKSVDNTWEGFVVKQNRVHSESYSDSEGVSMMSGSPDAWRDVSSQGSWESTDLLHPPKSEDSVSVPSPLSINMSHEQLTTLGIYPQEAHLVMGTMPEHRFRYRYDTEMCGTHGSLQGIRLGREKNLPSVELVGYPFEAFIRVSLSTCNSSGERFPHPHSLFVKEKHYQKKCYVNIDRKCKTRTGHFADPHYVRVGANGGDHLAKFEGMCIISSKKEHFQQAIREKLEYREAEKQGYSELEKNYNYRGVPSWQPEKESLSKKMESVIKQVDVDFVSLCYEAFREEDGKLVPICTPLYSHPIANAKSAKTGKLKIVRRNKCSGSCKGGDEIWLLVEKINKKGLVIKFFQEQNGRVVWESSIEGEKLELHHQYAIIFTTPAFRDLNITSEVEVFMRLERTAEPYDFSEPETFVYEPSKVRSSRSENLYKKESILTPKYSQNKRARTEFSASHMMAYNYPTKRRTDELGYELGIEQNTFHSPGEPGLQPDLQQLLLDTSLHFDAATMPDLEEFLQSLIAMEDVEMNVEKDGAPTASDRRKEMLKLLAQKLKEQPRRDWDVKDLTEQIHKLQVLRKEENSPGQTKEKERLVDAASTLLSLKNGIKTEPDKERSKTTRNERGGTPEARDTPRDGPREDLTEVHRLLNASGAWCKMAEMWDSAFIIPHAGESQNPARTVFNCAEEKHGKLELDNVRELLDAIGEVAAVAIIDEMMAKKFINIS